MKPEFKVCISMLIYGSLGLIVRAINLPSAHIVLVRAVIGCAALFAIGAVKSTKAGSVRPPRATIALLLGIGVLIGLNWVLLFEAYNNTYVSIATLLYYMQPVLLILLSRIFLKEKLTVPKIIGLIAAIAGMVLINGLRVGGSNPFKGMLLAFLAALLYAVIVFIIKASGRTDGLDGITMVKYQLLGAAAAMLIYVALSGFSPLGQLTGKDIILLVILGVAYTALPYVLYFSSLNALPAQTIAILGYIDPLSALVFSAVFLRERLSLLQIAGAVLILGGALFAQLVKPKKS